MDNIQYIKEQELWEQDIPAFDKIILTRNDEKHDEDIIGIDFGAKYTLITVMRGGKFISLKENGKMIPSVFTITNLGECLFGNRAMSYARIHKQSTLSLIKCCGYQKSISKYGFTFSAQYICTEFFRYLKELVESDLKKSVDGAVLVLSNMDMLYRWRIVHAAGNAGIEIKRIICKALACSLETLVRESFGEEKVVVCSFDGSFISGVCIEKGDGVIEVLSQKEMDVKENKGDLHNKIVEVIQELVREEYIGEDDIDRVMLFCNEPIQKDKIIYLAFQGRKKRVILDKLYDQPVKGAAIYGGKLNEDPYCANMLLLDACSHSISMAVWKGNEVESEVIPFIGNNTAMPMKISREIVTKRGESLDLYVLYSAGKTIHKMKPLAKVHLDGMWIGDATQVIITLDLATSVKIDMEIENPSANMRTRKQVYGCEYEQKEALDDITVKEVIEKVLSLVEGIEWGVRNLSEEERKTSTGKGLIQVYKKWKDVMRKLHITPIRAEGMYFNTKYHNAIMYVTDENLDENMIVEELQTGYMYRGQVIKPSLVKVAN